MREGAKDSKCDPHESWFVQLSADMPLQEVAPTYAHRLSYEHGYRFMKQDLLWTQARVRMPEQFERWSLLVFELFGVGSLACTSRPSALGT
ncbi:hypothetical protein [Ktedonobacter racemifer]|uniref:Transposase IS4 family protein n=1 Tax=Ktedonobacter racemifer DSM 44963 TaxID=485913 RepID=D6TH05_KTERA|nr:hypothetical protein [Ktedonobacter racemifer]EFH88934.1 hypothetical protein Krac_10449 [Ktedonobacter racemifer DSM 44963]